VFVLLNSKRASESDTKAEYTVFASFLQVYNEGVYDLLKDPDEADALSIHETVEEGVFVEGLSEYVIANAGDCLPIVAKGQANRYCRRISVALSVHAFDHPLCFVFFVVLFDPRT
jgi:hypothetical protein